MRMSALAAAVLPAAVLANRVAPLNLRNTAIKGEYIVQLFDEASLTSDDGAMKILKEEPRYTWKSAINGFSATMDEQTLEAMRQHPDVKQITENGMVKAAGWLVPGTEGPIVYQSPNPANDWLKQDKPVWGLARTSNKAPKGTVYEYHKSQGEGVCAWVVDSGVDAKHPEFEDRAENVLNMIKKEENTDLFNHGTHCAGTIASKTYGVAKKTWIRSIKVLDKMGNGPDDGIVEAINWMLENLPKRSECKVGHVVNMSFTADNIHPAMKEGCAKLVKAGYPVAVASGNKSRDASKDSPGDEPLVCTAAATDASDKKASFSNFGKLIDLNAPGVNVESTIRGGQKQQMSGTSMAAPHICGVAAALMAEKGTKGAAVCDELVKMATKDALGGLGGGTPNLLLFNGNPGAK